MVTRRTLLSMLASLPGVAALSRQTPDYVVVGPMTIDRERMLSARGVKVSVLVDGVDVTRRCQFADDTPGHEVARLLKHNADGRPYVDPMTREAARETKTGNVRIMLERKA